jgi:membrane dipeptidase
VTTGTPQPEVARLHEETVIVEGHRDCYEQIHLLNQGHDDPIGEHLLPRLRAGGVDVVVYAVGGDSIAHSNGRDQPLLATLENIAGVMDGIRRSAGAAALALSGSDLPLRPDDTIRFVLHLEGGRPLEGSLGVLESLFRLGVRSIQPVWNLRNELGDGVRETATGGGLTRFGVDVVREMERLGMLVDLAHMAEAGFWHALRIASGPITVSHANAKAVHDHPRNVSDEQVAAVAERGGVVGVHAVPVFVDESQPTVARLVDHVEHLVEIAGVEHVALGCDFIRNDGPRSGREQIPKRTVEELEGFGEIDELPVLTAALLDRGFTAADVGAILGGNSIRLLGQVLPG